MGIEARNYAFEKLAGLTTNQQCIFLRAADACNDGTGMLHRSKEWLADTCGVSVRTLQRELPQLAGLGLLVKVASGYRLTGYLLAPRQNGGALPETSDANLSANLSAKMAEQKESTKEKEFSLTSEVLKPRNDSSLKHPQPTRSAAKTNLEDDTRSHPQDADPLCESEVRRLTHAVSDRFSLDGKTARSVVLLGLIRSRARSRIASPEYFRPIVQEIEIRPLRPMYDKYLESKLEELRGVVVRAP